jgi:hypothetical protein
MKAFMTGLLVIALGILSGCNSLSTDPTRVDYISDKSCCDGPNAQSGYYYNGYKENGWKYCVVTTN